MPFGPGELFLGWHQFQGFRLEEIGARLGHDISVALGKLSIHHASVSGRLRRRTAARFRLVAVEVIGVEPRLLHASRAIPVHR
ncbi:hypothetical protein AB0E63_38130 [Kribbella sp. NPDC026596]|uniref:hypothetical protein n=1 Tax=Kribbella sp. NPDC026596 TaxID=3155122 RepID=UPI00340A459F